jgi:hypothetical protein
MSRAVALLAVTLALGCNNKDGSPAPAPEPPAEVTGEATEPPAEVATEPPALEQGWSGDDPFEPPAIQVDGDRVTVTLTRRAGVTLPAGRVPYTAEPYNLIGEPGADDTVVEADILGTGLALDLDGDGDTGDAIAVACDEGVISAAGATVPPLADRGDQVRTYTREHIARIGDEGAWVVSYSPCEAGPAQVGLSPADRPIEILHTDGPALQVMVFAPAAAPALPEPVELRVSADGVALATRTHTGLAYEPIFGDQPGWAAMHWVMVPVRDTGRQSFSFTLPAADGPRMVIATVNLGTDTDRRWRMKPAAAPIP